MNPSKVFHPIEMVFGKPLRVHFECALSILRTYARQIIHVLLINLFPRLHTNTTPRPLFLNRTYAMIKDKCNNSQNIILSIPFERM